MDHFQHGSELKWPGNCAAGRIVWRRGRIAARRDDAVYGSTLLCCRIFALPKKDLPRSAKALYVEPQRRTIGLVLTLASLHWHEDPFYYEWLPETETRNKRQNTLIPSSSSSSMLSHCASRKVMRKRFLSCLVGTYEVSEGPNSSKRHANTTAGETVVWKVSRRYCSYRKKGVIQGTDHRLLT